MESEQLWHSRGSVAVVKFAVSIDTVKKQLEVALDVNEYATDG
jgi:hypothetical protein